YYGNLSSHREGWPCAADSCTTFGSPALLVVIAQRATGFAFLDDPDCPLWRQTPDREITFLQKCGRTLLSAHSRAIISANRTATSAGGALSSWRRAGAGVSAAARRSAASPSAAARSSWNQPPRDGPPLIVRPPNWYLPGGSLAKTDLSAKIVPDVNTARRHYESHAVRFPSSVRWRSRASPAAAAWPSSSCQLAASTSAAGDATTWSTRASGPADTIGPPVS